MKPLIVLPLLALLSGCSSNDGVGGIFNDNDCDPPPQYQGASFSGNLAPGESGSFEGCAPYGSTGISFGQEPYEDVALDVRDSDGNTVPCTPARFGWNCGDMGGHYYYVTISNVSTSTRRDVTIEVYSTFAE